MRNLAGFGDALSTALLAVVDVSLFIVAIFCSLVSFEDENWDCKAAFTQLRNGDYRR